VDAGYPYIVESLDSVAEGRRCYRRLFGYRQITRPGAQYEYRASPYCGYRFQGLKVDDASGRMVHGSRKVLEQCRSYRLSGAGGEKSRSARCQ
jgi:hypothetical protein